MEVSVLGIGNILWADEGFGVRAVEALHAAYAFPEGVELVDGGTLGLNLSTYVESTRRLLVLDAIDFALAPGTVKVLRDAEVPAWTKAKLSPHQTGFNDILAMAALRGCAPESVTVIGVQPVDLMSFGAALTAPVRSRLPEAVGLAAREIAAWGFPGRPRAPGEAVEPLGPMPLAMAEYESGLANEDDPARFGDPRLIAKRLAGDAG
ncbi:MAG: HyaD/HybD family hydrogenase maturation endopeptidase [Burkholderiales bacterium]|nr:HyaD/HybD family hydrogenase maturation endopeptidase [Burkholderiales bacterium]